ETLIVKNVQREKFPFRLNPKDMVAKEAIVPAFIVLLVAIGFTSINAFFYVYAEEYGMNRTQASWFFTVYAAALFVTRPIIGKLTDKLGFVKTGSVAIVLTAASLVLIGYSIYLHSFWFLMAAALVISCGYGAAQPALQSLCIKSVSAERRGSGSATYYIGMDAGTIIGPILCGMVAKEVGYTPSMWIVVAIPVLVGAAAVLLFRKQIKKIETDFASRTEKA
ncbi:MAG: MFS transporter, partial [Clostridia bacterium]|nr:MFS transporter [Clostridia bacterium]